MLLSTFKLPKDVEIIAVKAFTGPTYLTIKLFAVDTNSVHAVPVNF